MRLDVNVDCEDCESEVLATLSQSFYSGELSWSMTYNCSNCGCNIEFDDVGLPPEKIRRELMMAHGKWRLSVSKTKIDNRGQFLLCLKRVFGVSLSESKRLLDKSDFIYEGTEVEVDYYFQVFQSNGHPLQKARVF